MEEKNLIAKIKKYANQNSDSLKTLISKYILTNIANAHKIKISDVAKSCFCSKSSIVKYCQKFGLDGFKELIRILIWEKSILNVFNNQRSQNSYNATYFENILENIDYLTEHYLGDFDLIAREIVKANRIFLFGKGPNIHICEIFKNYLIKLNYPCYSSTDLDVQKKIVDNVGKNDLCFVFTYSGLTNSMIKIWEKIKMNAAKVVILTSNSESFEFINSDYKFLIKNNEEIFAQQRSALIIFNIIIMQILNSLNQLG